MVTVVSDVAERVSRNCSVESGGDQHHARERQRCHHAAARGACTRSVRSPPTCAATSAEFRGATKACAPWPRGWTRAPRHAAARARAVDNSPPPPQTSTAARDRRTASDVRAFTRDGLPEVERLLRDRASPSVEVRDLSRRLRANPSRLLYREIRGRGRFRHDPALPLCCSRCRARRLFRPACTATRPLSQAYILRATAPGGPAASATPQHADAAGRAAVRRARLQTEHIVIARAGPPPRLSTRAVEWSGGHCRPGVGAHDRRFRATGDWGAGG